MANPKHSLPERVQKEKWKTYGWSAEQLRGRQTSRASVQRSYDRVRAPNMAAKRFLNQIRETELFWLALRKHVEAEEAQMLLAVFAQHSGWRAMKHCEEQKLRSECLSLLKECRHHNPGFEHQAMTERLQLEVVPDSEECWSQKRASVSPDLALLCCRKNTCFSWLCSCCVWKPMYSKINELSGE